MLNLPDTCVLFAGYKTYGLNTLTTRHDYSPARRVTHESSSYLQDIKHIIVTL